jgi:uncharacterized protein DUF2188
VAPVPSGSGERPTVGPKTGGGWQVSGDLQTNKTQREGELAARKLANGGGELVVKGRGGRIRMQNTIGRPDPRRSARVALVVSSAGSIAGDLVQPLDETCQARRHGWALAAPAPRELVDDTVAKRNEGLDRYEQSENEAQYPQADVGPVLPC